MAWIRMIDEAEARGRFKKLVARIAGKSGKIDNILKIHSLNPPSLEGHYELYKTLMYGRSPLSRVQREMIAVVVSTANECHY